MVIRIRYAADGSNRVPEMTATKLETLRKSLFGMYPTAEVKLTVRRPATE